MNKKPIQIGILKTEDFITIRITMFNKTKWKVIKRDVMRFDMFCIAIILMMNFLLISLSRNTILEWHEKIIIAIINIAMIDKYIKTRKEIIER